jgi:hypothetical protein
MEGGRQSSRAIPSDRLYCDFGVDYLDRRCNSVMPQLLEEPRALPQRQVRVSLQARLQPKW